MKKLKVFLCIILSVVCIACTSINSNAYSYKTYNYTKSMYTGNKIKFKPSKYTNSSNTTWKSSNTSYATVDKYGNVTAKKAGKVYITATYKYSAKKRYVYKYTVTIKNNTKYYYYTKSMNVGNKMKLNPSKYIKSTNTTWTSSNSTYATVDKYGNVTAKKAGKVYITATRKSGSNYYVYKYTITINDKKHSDEEIMQSVKNYLLYNSSYIKDSDIIYGTINKTIVRKDAMICDDPDHDNSILVTYTVKRYFPGDEMVKGGYGTIEKDAVWVNPYTLNVYSLVMREYEIWDIDCEF